ncbi:hypothetical protein BGZ49_006331 [Haplosporangium sp. Z 27]|nr:hypothetical protein BGZ49_006331 [Haplosporangium sp. Z 27]
MATLYIYAHGAHHLEDVEHFGRNDPYAQFTFDISDKKFYQKTAVKKNAGKNVEWNQELTLGNYNPNLNHYLYVEVFDEEHTVDAPIGFATLPLHQVLNAPNQTFKGVFDLYLPNGKQKGTITLTLAVLQPGQGAHGLTNVPEVKGISQLDGPHQEHIQKMKKKEHLADAAKILAVAGTVAGVNALHDQRKNDKQHS